MRLIDADAFKEYIRGACEEMSHVYKDGGKWAKQITEDFCMDIDDQPTVEERKTGEWINGYKRQTCSVCKQRGYRSWSFCPNCGAKMEAEA